MRRVVVSTAVTVDGRFEGPDRDLSGLPLDDGFSRHNLALLEGADTMLTGRIGYEGFLAYWPQVQHDESQPPIERAISRLNTTMRKLVISDTVEVDPDSPWAATTEVVRRDDAVRAVGARKAEEGSDIVMFGGASTWSPLAEAGLVDEVQVLVGPALLGPGRSVYEGGGRVALSLLDARRLDDSQLVLLRYAAA